MKLRSLLAYGIFADHEEQKRIMSGESKWSLDRFTALITNAAGTGGTSMLPTIMKLFAEPNFKPKDNFPVLPIELDNKVSKNAWIGAENVAPQDPRSDLFYHPDPSTFANLNNGDIIDAREVHLSNLWQNVKKAYQVSYKTENTYGLPHADVTTILVPHSPNSRVISWQNWEDAGSLQCAPSFSILSGIADPTFDLMLVMGYVINIPDHEGVNSAFAAGVKEGKSTLDSIRAYLNHKDKIELGDGFDKIFMWGYSGGGIATGHAAETMHKYAPELKGKIIGAAAGGYVANISQTVETISGGPLAGFCFTGINGLATEYPKIKELVEERVRPGIKWRFDTTKKTCLSNSIVNFLFHDTWSYTNLDSQDVMFDQRLQDTLPNEWLGHHGHPIVPMMIYQGVQDEIIAIKEVDRAVNHYCKMGSRIQYNRYEVLEHGATEVLGAPEVLEFIHHTFEGDVPPACGSAQEAVAVTDTHYHKMGKEYRHLVNGNWEESGILQYLAERGAYSPPASSTSSLVTATPHTAKAKVTSRA